MEFAGNIINSVNFPACALDSNGGERIIIASNNNNDTFNTLLSDLSAKGIQAEGMASHHRGDIYYNILEVAKGSDVKELVEKAKNVNNTLLARIIA